MKKKKMDNFAKRFKKQNALRERFGNQKETSSPKKFIKGKVEISTMARHTPILSILRLGQT